MTQTIVVTRTYNESIYVDLFLNYYSRLGVDRIIVFDSKSTDDTVEKIKYHAESLGNITLVSTPYRIYNYKSEVELNKFIWKYVLEDYLKYKEDCIYIFVDVDEFLYLGKENFSTFCKRTLNADYSLFRSIFIERFPTRSIKERLEKIYLNFDELFPLGRLQMLWNDPIYKYNIVKVSVANFDFLRSIRPSGGFHRWVKDKKVLLNNSTIFIVNHIRLVTPNLEISRIHDKLKLLNDKDDWIYVHYNLLLKELSRIANEIRLYGNSKVLKKVTQEFYNECLIRAYMFDQSNSYFNNVIMRENIVYPYGSKPSMRCR